MFQIGTWLLRVFFFFFLDVPSLITRKQGSLVGQRLRIMCGSDEK
jgi:hypothetical protein